MANANATTPQAPEKSAGTATPVSTTPAAGSAPNNKDSKAPKEEEEEESEVPVCQVVLPPPPKPRKYARRDDGFVFNVTPTPLPEKKMVKLLKDATKLFQKEPTLLEIPRPCIIVGDIHGQYDDLQRILMLPSIKKTSTFGVNRFLFMGDYVDRGANSLLVLEILLTFKLKNKDSYFMLRGNHETKMINRQYGFREECFETYNRNMKVELAETEEAEHEARKEEKKKKKEEKEKEKEAGKGKEKDKDKDKEADKGKDKEKPKDKGKTESREEGGKDGSNNTQQTQKTQASGTQPGEEETVFDLANTMFNYMPLAALIHGRILCMHGGISPDLKSLDDIRNIKRPVEDVIHNHLARDLLWADPLVGADKFMENGTRGVSVCFGERQIDEMCRRLKINFIMMLNGFSFMTNRRLLTLFSAPRYSLEKNSRAAVCVVHETFEVSLLILAPGYHRFHGEQHFRKEYVELEMEQCAVTEKHQEVQDKAQEDTQMVSSYEPLGASEQARKAAAKGGPLPVPDLVNKDGTKR